MPNVLDASGYLKANGLELQGVEGDNYIIADSQGQSRINRNDPAFKQDLNNYFKSQGATDADLKDAQYEFNDASKPIPFSPLDAGERAKLSFAPESAKIDLLSKKYGQVIPTEENGLVVNNKGVWQQIDPSMFGEADPWKITAHLMDAAKKGGKALVKGFAEGGVGGAVSEAVKEIPSIVSENYVPAIGAAISETGKAAKGLKETAQRPGALKELAGDFSEMGPDLIKGIPSVYGEVLAGPGGAALGGLAGSIGTTVLGKLIGVDNSSPEEEAAQWALDAVFSFGGAKIAPGVKPTMEALGSAASEITKRMSQGAKDAFAPFYGAITKTGQPAAEFFLNKGDQFAKRLDILNKSIPPGSGSKALVTKATDQNLKYATKLVERARTELTNEYESRLNNLFKTTNAEVDFAKLIPELLQSVESSGYGKAVAKDVSVPSTPSSTGILGAFGKPVLKEAEKVNPNIKWSFQPFSEDEVLARGNKGIESLAPNPATVSQLNELVKDIGVMAKLGKQEGEVAAKNLISLQQKMNQFKASKLDTAVYDQMDRAISTIGKRYGQVLKNAFEAAGSGEEYASLARLYGGELVEKNGIIEQTEGYKDAVDWALRKINRDGGTEQLVKGIVEEGTGKRGEAVGNVKLLKQLLNGEGKATGEGQQLIDTILANHSVAQFAPVINMDRFTGGIATGGATTAIAMGTNPLLAAGAIAGGALATSPKITSTGILAARKGGKFLHGLSKDAMNSLIGNDAAFQQFMSTILGAEMRQSQLKDSIMNQVHNALNPPQPPPQQANKK